MFWVLETGQDRQDQELIGLKSNALIAYYHVLTRKEIRV